jgi:hypothetical protein
LAPATGIVRRDRSAVTLPGVVERPTAYWREQVVVEKARVASATLDPNDAFAVELWPERMIQDTDEVLDRFDTAVAGLVEHRLEVASDAEIFEAIRCVVLYLNAVDARHDGPYETGEREQLCEYIESALERADIDVGAFAARHRITRHEITDEWRDW